MSKPLSRIPPQPRCLTCAYVLSGIGDVGRCPECGASFDLHNSSTFTYRRPLLGWKYWLLGFGVASAVGVTLLILDFLVIGASGWSVWMGVPLVTGMLCGYFARVRVYGLALLALMLMMVLLVGVASASIGGVFCVLILSGIAAVPLAIGSLAGHLLRVDLRRRGYDLRKPLALVLAACAGIACGIIDRATTSPYPLCTVATSVTIEEPIDLVWSSVQFYEDVQHDPPLILRVGLVRPLHATGSSSNLGDTRVCIYNKGRLVKRVSAVSAPHLLEFSVIEQKIGYERDVRLDSGSFRLEEASARSTIVTLTTTYRPLLGPRWVWNWGESYAIHTLHEYVLEGMRRHALKLDRSRSALLQQPLP